MQLPSVIIDAVLEDFLDATAGSVLSGIAPFALVDGSTITIEIDGGAPQTIAFNEVDFVDISKATAAEVVIVLNASLANGRALREVSRVRIVTATFGAGGSVQVLTQPAALAFPSGLSLGTDAAVQTLLINRIPESAEREVPLESSIHFEIYEVGGTAPLLDTVDVQVNGVAVLTAGVPIGWSLASSNPDASTLAITLTPVQLYTSDGDVHVEVDSGGFHAQYTFHTFDLIAPHTLVAQARDKRTIRVTFSEALQQLDASSTADALNPANYLIERVSVPAVGLEVIDVHSVSGSMVDLRTDIEMTFGAGYELTVINVQDIAGNAHVLAPDNVVPFSGFLPEFPIGRRFLLQEFLPRMNFGEDAEGDLRRFIAVIQEVTNVLLSDVDEWSETIDLDLAAEQYLDCMLEDLGNPFDFDLSEIDKRRLLRILVRLYQLKGTRPGLLAAIQFFLGIAMEVEIYTGTGWELGGDDDSIGDELSEFEDGTPPAILGPDSAGIYSFRVISPVDLTATQRAQVRALAEYMKVGHEHYLGTIEPSPQAPIDHLELDFSALGEGVIPGDFLMH